MCAHARPKPATASVYLGGRKVKAAASADSAAVTTPGRAPPKLVKYPQAGYRIAYSRTACDPPLVIITMRKSP